VCLNLPSLGLVWVESGHVEVGCRAEEPEPSVEIKEPCMHEKKVNIALSSFMVR
jgi:hypothetical protein